MGSAILGRAENWRNRNLRDRVQAARTPQAGRAARVWSNHAVTEGMMDVWDDELKPAKAHGRSVVIRAILISGSAICADAAGVVLAWVLYGAVAAFTRQPIRHEHRHDADPVQQVPWRQPRSPSDQASPERLARRHRR